MLTRLKDVLDNSRPDETLLVYFAGYGLAADGNFYLCTADTHVDDLTKTAVSGSELGVMVSECSCQGILVLLDCCESAAAAEHAPTAFSSLRNGEFRLLIASARAGQKSWETKDGRGTFFSRTLLEILNAQRVVGKGDGAIYFSDLIEGLDAGIAEQCAVGPVPPEQDMIFVGTYSKDPLVLVLRAQTLKAVRFATARYSLQHLRRKVIRSLVGLAAAIAFGLVSWYGIIDRETAPQSDPPTTGISTAYSADRRRDPVPIHIPSPTGHINARPNCRFDFCQCA